MSVSYPALKEKLGRFASARRAWWDQRRAALQSSDPDYEGGEKDAEAART